jgi:hypothetical protein
MDDSFPMRRYTQSLDLRFKSYEVLRFQVIFGHAVSYYQCNEFCPKLPKSAQSRNFEMPPKITILVIFKNKNLYVKKRH